MLHKTRGVVFRYIRYGETSIIVNIFTELFGLQSYIVNGIRSKSSKNKIALYQPLTLLDLVVYYREHANIKRIKETKCIHPYQSIPVDIKKSAIAMFINEIINKTVKEESHAHELCDFLISSLIKLDTTPNAENFHLIFLLKLSRHLGFGVHHVNHILEGGVATPDVEQAVRSLIEADYQSVVFISSNARRREILDLLITFYQQHIDTLGEIKSVQVLREILQ